MQGVPPPAGRGRARRRALLALGVAALAALPHLAGGLSRATHLDDELYVFDNPRVLGGLTAAGARWALTSLELNNWHPLTWLSHMTDVSLFGTAPAGHHATSVLLHAAAAALLLLALARMTGAPWRSALAAALFAAHPLLVQPVAWIADRKDVLAGALFMLLLVAYERYVRRGGTARYLAVCATLALGLAAKAMLVTAPLLLLLLDAWPLGRLRAGPAPGASRARVLLEKLPLLGLSAGASALAWVAQRRAGALVDTGYISPAERLANAVVSSARALAQVFWPAGIAAYYPYHRHAPAAVALALATLAALTFLALRARRRRPFLLAGWLWYLVALVPVAGFVQVGEQARADRYLYLPVVGVFVAVAWVLPGRAAGRGRRRAALAAAAGAVGLLAVLATVQARAWADPVELYRRAISATEGNWLMHNNLGARLLESGELEEAEEQLRAALRLRPSTAAHANLGLLLARTGRLDEAEREHREALRLDPGSAAAHVGLAAVLARTGRPAEAEAHYREALRLAPRSVPALTGLSVVLAGRGDLAAAVDLGREALRLDPGSAEVRNNLGIALARLGRQGEAAEQFREAARLDPDLARPHTNLALVLAGLGRPAEAEAELREAMRLRPGLPGVRYNLGILLAAAGRSAEAVAAFRSELRVQPGAARARARLGIELAGLDHAAEALEQTARALRERPDLAVTHYARGVALAAADRTGEAAAAYRAALRIDPGHAEARRRLGDLLAGMGAEAGRGTGRPGEAERRELP